MAYLANDNAEMAIQNLKLYLGRRPGGEDPLRVRTAEDTVAKLEARAAEPPAP